jgi:hypothetical protein
MSRAASALALAVAIVWLAAAPVMAAPPAVEVWAQANVTPILVPGSSRSLAVPLAPQFEVLPGGRVVGLSAAGGLFDLTRREALPAKHPLRLNAFTADGGLLIGVRDRRLGWYEAGEFAERIELPEAGLAVAAGPRNRLYLHGPRGAGSVVYLMEQGKAGMLLDVPEGRISALTVIGERLFFAVGNTIYTVAEGQRPAVLFIAAGESGIRSLAADPVSGLLFFSAGKGVYAMRAGVAVSVLRGMEGTLRCAGGELYVLDAGTRTLVRVQGLEWFGRGEAAPAASEAPAGQFKD